MLAVDDLRPVGSAFGEPEVLTPNIDKLAARATIFREAYVQASTCGVSRSSLLTSRRPDTTQVIRNEGCPFRTQPEHAKWVSLPQHFRLQGFSTFGMGKVWHPNVCDGAAAGEHADDWSSPYYHAPCISLGSIFNHTCYESYPGPLPEGPGGKVTSIYGNNTPGSAEDMPDGMIAARAVSTLQELATRAGKADGDVAPFFLAVGLHKPHLPHIAPQEFFDLYPLDNVSLPDNASRHAPQGAPAGVWNGCGEFRSYHDVQQVCSAEHFSQSRPLSDASTRLQRRAYYAAASFADAQIGKVLGALETTGLANSTVVCLFGDHGWHVGENNEWAKHTSMTWANRVPLLFAVPGGDGKVVSNSFAELVDIMPTLAELAGVSVPPRCANDQMSANSSSCTEGASLASAVLTQELHGASFTAGWGDRPSQGGGGKSAAFSQWGFKKVAGVSRMGYNLYTHIQDTRGVASQVRYTEWVTYRSNSGKVPHGPEWQDDLTGIVELYNRTGDLNENANIATAPGMQGLVKELSNQLHAGWRAVRPPL